MKIISADHQIKNEKKFRDLIEIGKLYSEDNKIVTFGIPSSPETGYGYIQTEKPFNLINIEGYKISKFIEKPDFQKSKRTYKR